MTVESGFWHGGQWVSAWWAVLMARWTMGFGTVNREKIGFGYEYREMAALNMKFETESQLKNLISSTTLPTDQSVG